MQLPLPRLVSRVLSLFVVVLSLSAWSTTITTYFVNALAAGDVTYDIQSLPTYYRRIRVTFYGSNFTRLTRFRLTNISNCGDGALAALANDNFSQEERWTDYDFKSYYVASFAASGEATVAYACVSYDKGRHYFSAKNLENRYHFRVWGKVPTAKINPKMPIATANVRITIGNLPSGSRAALVETENGCRGSVPLTPISGGASTAVTFTDASSSFVDFVPTQAYIRAFVCVATPPTLNDWTLAPVDESDEIIFRSWNYNNIPAPSDMITGRITTAYFTIFQNGNQWNQSSITCNGPLVQGKSTRCYMQISNDTAMATNATLLSFLSLTDGAGVAECPLPPFVQENVTHVYFDWVPQRWGREGRISVRYNGLPIKMMFATIAGSSTGYDLPNTTHYADNISEDVVTRFLVLPPNTQSVDYDAQPNLLTNIQAFAGLANFVVTEGNPDATSNSTAMGGEAFHATLISSVTDANMTRTVSGIASASRCKFRVRYAFYPSTGFPDQTETSLVGRASITSRDSSPADIKVLKTFYVYVQGQSIVVAGTDIIPLGITGDIRTPESLSYELAWSPDQDGYRVELEIFHGRQQRFYWSEPELKCLPSSAGGPTLASDVTALQNIYTAIGGNGKWRLTASWRNTANTGFNGDPCLNGWVGVICRNQRVTELQLDNIGLDGTLPSDLAALTFLEVLRIGHNEFVGALPATMSNLVRLSVFDISHNQFRSVPSTFASQTTNLCLKRFFAQKNLMEQFPSQTQLSPTLETLRLEWNQMAGDLPNYTDPTIPLRELSVAHNKLSAYVPQFLPFDTLLIVDLSDNKFDGPIPSAWSQFKNIQYLDVSHNQLQGGVPFEMAMIRSASYLTFRAQDNYIGGIVPRLPFESYDLRQNIINCPDPSDEKFTNEFHIKGLLYDECDYSGWVEMQYTPYTYGSQP